MSSDREVLLDVYYIVNSSFLNSEVKHLVMSNQQDEKFKAV